MDTPPLIRAAEGLEPSGSKRCPAHTTGLSATPGGPACPSRASGRDLASLRWGFPCRSSFPWVDMPSPLPRWDRWVRSFGMRGSQPLDIHQRRRPSPFLWRVGSHIIPFEACSAFTHVTACPLAESLNDPFHRRLRRLRYLHRRSDCYRLERLSCRAGFAPAGDRRLFTAHTENRLKP